MWQNQNSQTDKRMSLGWVTSAEAESRRRKDPQQICPKWPEHETWYKGTKVVIPVWALIPTGP